MEIGMNKYVIVAESGADLTREMIDRHHIHVAQMHVALGDKDYPDDRITVKELSEYYDKTGKLPTTSAASPNDFQLIYEQVIKETPDATIIHIGYSSKLSAAFQNSMIANDTGVIKSLFHIDSLNCSMGQAFIVMKAAKLIEENPDLSPEEIVRIVDGYAALTRFSFIPGNLNYLRAGGRVSNAQYLGATLFGIKPLIELLNGLMIPTKKYRGTMHRIIRNMIKEFFEKYNIDKKEIFLGETEGLSNDLKVDIEQQIRQFGVKEFVWIKSGNVIFSHAGPGAFGIVGMDLNRK
jgi:DegV family protein with EDD domain